MFKAGQGAGQSGSFFFFSHDNRFIIKTLRGKESKILLNMLDDLILHYQETKNSSLLARIYGLYSIKTNIFGPLEVIVMQNTSAFISKNNQKMVFDLKGSIINRMTRLGKDETFWR